MGCESADALARDEQVLARATQTRPQAVLDKAPQGVLVCTAEEMLYAKQALARIHGFDSAHEFRKTGADAAYIHPDDRDMVVGRGKARMSNRHAPQQYEYRFLRADGSNGWMECNATATIWDGQPTSLSWLTGISARKHVEEALRRSERLFSKVFHEIRTPSR